MLIRNLIKTSDDGNYGARADRALQTGRVLLVDTKSGEAMLDVGMVNANGAAVYMQGVAFSPQTPPHGQDTVPIIRTQSSPYSAVIGGGSQTGGANSGQHIDGPFVSSIKKTGETTGQQGDLTLDPGRNTTIDRVGKVFTIGDTNVGTIGGLQGTGVTLVQDGQNWYYYYNGGIGSNQTIVLPNLILASGGGQQITYTFVNFSDYNIGVFANTVTYTNYIEGVGSLGIGPGQYFTFQGIQGTGSDGIWRVTNYNQRLTLANLQTGTSYTLSLGDLGKVVATSNASAVTVTVPTNATAKFPVGALVQVNQIGTGQVTLAAAGGVTLHNSGGLSTIKQYASMMLRQIAADEWLVTNDVYGVASASPTTQSLSIVLNNGTSALAVGQYVDLVFEYACTIQSNTLLADQSGSVQLDLRKCTYADFDDSTHPASGDSICASAKPTITTATKSQDLTLTGWTVAMAAGDVVRVYVVSATTITQVTCSLKVSKT